MTLRRWTQRLLPQILVVISVALIVTVPTAFALGWLTYDWAPRYFEAPPPPPRDANFALEPFKVALTFAAGLGGAVALTVSYRKQQVTERDENRAQDAARRAEEAADRDKQWTKAQMQNANQTAKREDQKELHVRYGAAAAQLGHTEATVRLAGAYALANLADEWESQKQQVTDVLVAYLRLPWIPEGDSPNPLAARTIQEPLPPAGTITYTYPNHLGEAEVRRTILKLITVHLQPEHLRAVGLSSWSELHFDFTGALLPTSDFTNTQFSGPAVFDQATFLNTALFKDATFSDDVSFKQAEFSDEAIFTGATFAIGTNFEAAKFTEVCQFDGATFWWTVTFRDVVFEKQANFGPEDVWSGQKGARFQASVNFCDATFKDRAVFENVHFYADANFAGARFRSSAHFRDAQFCANTSFRKSVFEKFADFSTELFFGDVHFEEINLPEGVRRALTRVLGNGGNRQAGETPEAPDKGLQSEW